MFIINGVVHVHVMFIMCDMIIINPSSSGGGNQTCFSTLVLFPIILYMYTLQNSWEGKCTSGMGYPYAPHP